MKKPLCFLCPLIALLLVCASAQAETPKQTDTIPITMAAGLVFPHIGTSAEAGFTNKIESGYDMRYTVQIPVDGVEVSLFKSELVHAGESVQRIRLDPLPEGITLEEGTHPASVLVEPFDPLTGVRANKVFLVESYIQIMTDERETHASSDGTLSLIINNDTGKPSCYALIMSAAELCEVSGIALHSPYALSQSDTMIELWTSELPPDPLQKTQPHVSGLPAGVYSTYLIRTTAGEAPYGISRIKLIIETELGDTIAAIPTLDESIAIAYAQAVVNCDYLLSIP